MKKCIKCHQIQEITNFYTKKTGKDGYSTICKPCTKLDIKNRGKTQETKDKHKQWRINNFVIIRTYNHYGQKKISRNKINFNSVSNLIGF